MSAKSNRDMWQQFRAEIIDRDGNVCRRCGRGGNQGAILQVHHRRYIDGHKPWEYCHDQCETLCKACHAAEHGKIPPRTGWTCVASDDLGDLVGECDCCGTGIRHVFYVHHPRWIAMAVGTICCDQLTGTTLASDQIESGKRLVERRARFMQSPRWIEFDSLSLITQNDIDVRISKSAAGYRIHLNAIAGNRRFPDLHAAKEYVFEMIDTGQAKKFLQDHPSTRQKSRARGGNVRRVGQLNGHLLRMLR